jgi:hypothetical protein
MCAVLIEQERAIIDLYKVDGRTQGGAVVKSTCTITKASLDGWMIAERR